MKIFADKQYKQFHDCRVLHRFLKCENASMKKVIYWNIDLRKSMYFDNFDFQISQHNENASSRKKLITEI